MQTIRGWLFYIVLSLALIPAALGCVLLWPVFSARQRYEWFGRPWARFVIAALRVLCGLTFEVRGVENIPPPGERIIVLSKHQSAWETIFLPYFVPQRLSFVYKRSLHWIPFFGWALKSMKMMGIDRTRGAAAFRLFNERGRRFLSNGWWILLFPEGTRVAPGKRAPYKTGGARFACATEAKVLPVAHNAGVYWAKNSIAKKPGVITVSFGPLIETEGKTHEQVNIELQAWIEAEVSTMNGCSHA